MSVDLEAIRANIAQFVALAGPAQVMAVVKAGGYGHGAVPVARAALDAGARWLGVAHVAEALELRSAGITDPILAWLHTSHTDFDAAVCADVRVAASSAAHVAAIAAAARRAHRQAEVHVKVDTGLGRNGATMEQLPTLLAAVKRAGDDIHIGGVMSHLSGADDPASDPYTDRQAGAFRAAAVAVAEAGIEPGLRHLSNTSAVLRRPDLMFDMVRVGIGMYGLWPLAADAPRDIDLRPALSLRSSVAAVKDIPPGHGVSYGPAFVADGPRRIGLVPVGYGDGVPRRIRGAGVTVDGRLFPVVGMVAMDQMMIDITGPFDIRVGDEVIVIAADGPNDVAHWAASADSIPYEIVTRLGPRLHREFLSGART